MIQSGAWANSFFFLSLSHSCQNTTSQSIRNSRYSTCVSHRQEELKAISQGYGVGAQKNQSVTTREVIWLQWGHNSQKVWLSCILGYLAVMGINLNTLNSDDSILNVSTVQKYSTHLTVMLCRLRTESGKAHSPGGGTTLTVAFVWVWWLQLLRLVWMAAARASGLSKTVSACHCRTQQPVLCQLKMCVSYGLNLLFIGNSNSLLWRSLGGNLRHSDWGTRSSAWFLCGI